MTEVSVVNCKTDEKEILVQEHVQLGVKLETEVIVKQEVVECLVCLGRSGEHCDLSTANTSSGTSLQDFLCKFTNSDLSKSTVSSKFVCKTCLNLVNVLEQAEIEYIKLKEEFKSIINKNPLFESSLQDDVSLESIKNECLESVAENDNDSEDEPLALTKKKRHRKVDKRKKKSMTDVKHKVVSKENEGWECGECSAQGSSGGPLAGATHVLLAHTLTSTVDQLKKEESSDRSQSPNFTELDTKFNIKVEGFEDDDNSSNYAPDDSQGRKRLRTRGKRKHNKDTGHKEKDPKVVHHCDQCDANASGTPQAEARRLQAALHLRGVRRPLQAQASLRHTRRHAQGDQRLEVRGVQQTVPVQGSPAETQQHPHRQAQLSVRPVRQVLHPHVVLQDAQAVPLRREAAAAAVAGARRRLFRCSFCPERFERRYMLERHAGAAHGRALERPPPTPRNTMSKLLKAQAQRREHAPTSTDDHGKPSRGNESRPSAKQLSQISSPGEVGGSWTGAYVAEFGLRADYTH
ncbi:hypothetical protein KGM_211440 [Danaus plexippus plexippus]|uniref:C2H2-type domain-containing protein n=1 Tax=Danaus plexippus plexippus TaxID=278856 RepID=A0A212FKE1_DANPL|nr:hypothetical protein KGM_211440 [Danaus plexippus plexippus]